VKKYTTNTKADPRKTYRVVRNGVPTPFSIAVPYSGTSVKLQLGRWQISLNHANMTANCSAVPDSWFVDISQDVLDESDLW
jgi:hypothetical protein